MGRGDCLTDRPGLGMREWMAETPLSKKLGIKSGQKALVLNPPENYDTLLGDLPEGVELSHDTGDGAYDVVHAFTRNSDDLRRLAPEAMAALKPGARSGSPTPRKAPKSSPTSSATGVGSLLPRRGCALSHLSLWTIHGRACASARRATSNRQRAESLFHKVNRQPPDRGLDRRAARVEAQATSRLLACRSWVRRSRRYVVCCRPGCRIEALRLSLQSCPGPSQNHLLTGVSSTPSG